MSMKKRIIILVVSLIIITGIIVGVSYAFFSTGGKQETANTFTSGCLNISLTDVSASISLSNIYPITDIEGLDTTSYDFTITNTCNTDANYEINLESLNQVSNSLSADYIKVSLSSDTVGNVISILSDNTSVTPEVANAYEAYNLYTGTLKASETKTYHLKLWLDYDATVEVAANKVYQSKINVIANPDIQVVDTLEATFELSDKILTSNLTNNVTSASYCTTTDNICEPNISATINNNSYTVELGSKESNQMLCTKLNDISKIICSNIIEGVQLCPEEATACNTILTGNEIKSGTPDFNKTSCTSECGEKTVGIYEATDDLGTSYYYRGDVKNNYVQFAGFYWRIIRINGDGSIRIIYDGTSAHANGESSEDRQIGISAYNDNYGYSYLVGYTYTTAQRPSTQNSGTASTIKGVLDNWYATNISGKGLDDKVVSAPGFCNDREMRTGYSWSATPSSNIYYKAYERLYTNKTPTLQCSNTNDIYTTKVGLITADEISMAGGVFDTSNRSYYLYAGQNYWAISPSLFDGVFYNGSVFYVAEEGSLSNYWVDDEMGVRPILNLSANVTLTGNGTATDPYVIL